MIYRETPQGLQWTGETTKYFSDLRRRSIPVEGGPQVSPIDPYIEEHWSKCPSCGAYNGSYYKPLEQHRPRCRWKGDASTQTLMAPNYFQMIDENDPRFLAAVRAQEALRSLENELRKCVPASIELEKCREAERRKKEALQAQQS